MLGKRDGEEEGQPATWGSVELVCQRAAGMFRGFSRMSLDARTTPTRCFLHVFVPVVFRRVVTRGKSTMATTPIVDSF